MNTQTNPLEDVPKARFSKQEIKDITEHYAEQGEVITRAQIDAAVHDLVEIMLVAEQEFGFVLTEEAVSQWYADPQPEPAPQSPLQP